MLLLCGLGGGRDNFTQGVLPLWMCVCTSQWFVQVDNSESQTTQDTDCRAGGSSGVRWSKLHPDLYGCFVVQVPNPLLAVLVLSRLFISWLCQVCCTCYCCVRIPRRDVASHLMSRPSYFNGLLYTRPCMLVLCCVGASDPRHEVGRPHPRGGRYRPMHHAQQGSLHDRQDAPAGKFDALMCRNLVRVESKYARQVCAHEFVRVDPLPLMYVHERAFCFPCGVSSVSADLFFSPSVAGVPVWVWVCLGVFWCRPGL